MLEVKHQAAWCIIYGNLEDFERLANARRIQDSIDDEEQKIIGEVKGKGKEKTKFDQWAQGKSLKTNQFKLQFKLQSFQ